MQEIWLRIIAVVAGGNRNTLCINKLIHVASSNTLWRKQAFTPPMDWMIGVLLPLIIVFIHHWAKVLY